MNSKEVNSILLAYNLGPVTFVEKLSGGVENGNFHITTDTDEYVLRIYNHSHSIRGERSLESVIEELNFVVSCKPVLPVAMPIANKFGHLASKLPGGEIYALFEYVKGDSPLELNASIVREYAKILGGLYKASSTYIASRTHLEYDLVSRATDAAENYISVTPDIDAVVNGLKKNIRASKPLLSNMPKGIVHGDIKLSNTLFDNGRLVALLDFDDYRYSYLIEDTTIAIMHNIHEPKQNILRAGLLKELLVSITSPGLHSDIQNGLRMMIQARLLYDVCKYSKKDTIVLQEILDDPNIKEYL